MREQREISRWNRGERRAAYWSDEASDSFSLFTWAVNARYVAFSFEENR